MLSQNDKEFINEVRDKFHSLLTVAYFTSMAYSLAGERFLQGQVENSKKTGFKIEELDDKPFAFVKDEKNMKINKWDAVTNQKIVKNVLQGNSDHVYLLRNYIVCGLYDLWKENIRPHIAKDLGLQPIDIKSDLFGDLGYIRNDIVHHRHKATKKNIGRNKIIKWFKIGQYIKFETPNLSDLDDLIYVEIEDLITNLINEHSES